MAPCEWQLFTWLDEVLKRGEVEKLTPLDRFWVTVYRYVLESVDYRELAEELELESGQVSRLSIWDLGLLFALHSYLHYNKTGNDSYWRTALEYLKRSGYFVYSRALKPDIGLLLGFCCSRVPDDDVRGALEYVKDSTLDELSFRVYYYVGQLVTKDKVEGA